MNHQTNAKPTGILYVVATPIGNLEDISLRALNTLKSVNLIACEDTKTSRILTQHYRISTLLTSYHKFNEVSKTPTLIKKLLQGQNIAIISDAGTPLINDPGAILVQQAQRHHITINAIPGACALISAISVSSINCSQFEFVGFLPKTYSKKIQFLSLCSNKKYALVFYESSHRITHTIQCLQETHGTERMISLARELTKKFETVIEGNCEDIITYLTSNANHSKGEFVVIVAGKTETKKDAVDIASATISVNVQQLQNILHPHLKTKQISQVISDLFTQATAEEHKSVSKKMLYKFITAQKNNQP